jgi:hypothetical protein
VHPSGRRGNTVRKVVFMVWTIKLHIWKLCAPVQPSGRQPLRSGRSKPYYGNYVQPKCNRPDARATLSGHGLVMEAFSAILERRLQLTVRTLGQAVRPIEVFGRPPSGRKHLASRRPCKNSRITFWTKKKVPVRMRVPQTPFLTFRPSKAYK